MHTDAAPGRDRAARHEWFAAIDAWTDYLRAAGRAEGTIRLRRVHVREAAVEHPTRSPWALSTTDLTTWCAGKDWQRETRRSVRSSLRGFYAWAQGAGLTDTNPADGLPTICHAPPHPHPTPDDILARATTKADPREGLMISLASRCGLRRGEVARVHSTDLTREPGGWSLRVRGKGDRERVVPIPDDIARTLRGRGPGWAFPNGDGGHLTADRVGVLVGDLLPPGWTMHSLRHRFATRAYAATGDLLAVQQLLGHASPATTQIYVRVAGDALRRAMLAAA